MPAQPKPTLIIIILFGNIAIFGKKNCKIHQPLSGDVYLSLGIIDLCLSKTKFSISCPTIIAQLAKPAEAIIRYWSVGFLISSNWQDVYNWGFSSIWLLRIPEIRLTGITRHKFIWLKLVGINLFKITEEFSWQSS